MSDQPLAFHITFGTYGARLHGGERTTVDREHNQFGTPFIDRDDARHAAEEAALNYPPVILGNDQRIFIERTIPTICVRGGWRYHMAAAQRDHIHALLTANVPGKVVRKLLKRWLGQALDERWPSDQTNRWWAIGGSIRCIWDDDYFHNAYRYIEAQQCTAVPDRSLS